MFQFIYLWFGALVRSFRPRRDLLLENLALRQQLTVLKRRHPKPKLGLFDKLFWVSARRFWSAWKQSLRRRILHLNVTRHPTIRWIVQQLREAFPYQTAPRFLIFDHDQKYGSEVPATVRSMKMAAVQTAVQSPWQNGVARALGRQLPKRTARPCYRSERTPSETTPL
jgi:putative transposase